MIELAINIGMFAGLMVVGYFWGTHNEKKHYRSIIKREKQLLHLPAVPLAYETVVQSDPDNIVEQVRFVKGSVVLAEDFFKSFLASLKTFFGGNLTSYESLMDRARREAIIRMKEDALGADIIVSLRLDTSSITKEGGADGKGAKSIEVLASGTAIYFEKNNSHIPAHDSVHS